MRVINLILVQQRARETVEQLLGDIHPDLVGLLRTWFVLYPGAVSK